MNIFLIKLAFRSILRKKGFTIINLMGLALGLAASLYIATFLFQEYSYDKSYANSENIYRGIIEYDFGDNNKTSAFCPSPAGPDIIEAVPEINRFTRVSDNKSESLKLGNTFFEIENIYAADENFFKFLGHELLVGNTKEVLKNPNQIVLSESEAKRLFGNENPIGKSFLRSNGVILTVSGVFNNFPINSTLKTDAIYSFKTLEQDKSITLKWNGGETFLTLFRLNKGASAELVNPKIQEVLDEKINKVFKEAGWKMEMSLQKMEDTHLTTDIDFNVSSTRDKAFLFLISLVGAIILLLAIVNYLNLTSALAGGRGKQVGIQKLSGAVQNKIILQGFAEALLTTFFASILSIIILGISSSYLDSLLNTHVVFYPIRSAVILISMVIVTGLLAGIYPSIILARKSILSSFRKNDFKSRRQPLRNVLVIFQFGIAVVFIIALLTINRQFSYLLNQNMGFNSANVIQLQMHNEYETGKLNVLKNEIERLSEVEKTSYSSQPVGVNVTMNGYSVEGSEKVQIVNTLYADAGFIDFYKLKLQSGRNFYNSKSDTSVIIVNQAFIKQQNWDSWIGKTVGRNGKKEIIGVVQDFNFAPLTTTIKPLLIDVNPTLDGWSFQCLNIRLSSTNIEASLKSIESIWTKFEPNAPIELQFLEDRLNKAYSDIAIYKKIVFLFSLLAVFIACMGLLGLTAFINRLRIKEIGIRQVYGATLVELLVMLMKDFSKWVLIALVLAIPVSWYLLNQWLQTYAYRTTLSWWIFALAGILALGIALLTVSWQSWRAATRNPVEALRYE